MNGTLSLATYDFKKYFSLPDMATVLILLIASLVTFPDSSRTFLSFDENPVMAFVCSIPPMTNNEQKLEEIQINDFCEIYKYL